MRIWVLVGAMLAGMWAAPAMADPVCDQAKINLEDIRSGKDHVNGIPEGRPQMAGLCAANRREGRAGCCGEGRA